MDILMPDGAVAHPGVPAQRRRAPVQDRRRAERGAQRPERRGGIDGELLPLVSDDARVQRQLQLARSARVAAVHVAAASAIEPIVEVFNLFNVTNILGVSDRNYSGYSNVLVRDSSNPASPGYLRSSSFGKPVTTAGGVVRVRRAARRSSSPVARDVSDRHGHRRHGTSLRARARPTRRRSATALVVVGQVIAVGIFLTPGAMIRTLASPLWVLVVWVLIGGMAICGALCYGALAARYPHAGGGYVYLREAYGRGWRSCTDGSAFWSWIRGSPRRSRPGFASYVGYIVPLGPMPLRLVAIAAILAARARAHRGVKPGTRLLTTLRC